MGWRHFAGTTWLLAALVVIAPLVAAQEADSPQAAPEPPPWAKLCNPDPSSGKRLCLTIHEVRGEDGRFIASATVRTIEGAPKKTLIVAAPTGMLLQPGLRVRIDDEKWQAMQYGICFPNACYGELEVDDKFVVDMKSGRKITITALDERGKPVDFPMALAGFASAYDGSGLDQAAMQQRTNELQDIGPWEPWSDWPLHPSLDWVLPPSGS